MDKLSKEKKVTKSSVTANQILAGGSETSKNMPGSYTDIDPLKNYKKFEVARNKKTQTELYLK